MHALNLTIEHINVDLFLFLIFFYIYEKFRNFGISNQNFVYVQNNLSASRIDPPPLKVAFRY